MSEKDKVSFRLSALDEEQFNFFNEKYRRTGSIIKTIKLIMDINLNRDLKEYEETKTFSSKPLKKKQVISFRLSSLYERQIRCWNETYNRTNNVTETIKGIIDEAIKLEEKREEEEKSKPKITEIHKESQVDIMIRLIREKNWEPYIDMWRDACIKIDGVKRYLDSKFVKECMTGIYHDETSRLPSDVTINKVLDFLIYEAREKEKEQLKKVDFKPPKIEEGKLKKGEPITIKDIEEPKKKRKSHADIMIELAKEHIDRLFIDKRGKQYMVVGEYNDIIPIYSDKARRWLVKLFVDKIDKAPSKSAIDSTKDYLASKAEEIIIPLYNRIAPDGLGGIYIDMANEANQAIHITKDGYDISTPPIFFRRYEHQLSLPIPEEGGNIDDLLLFLNIKDEDDKKLIIPIIIHYFIPEISHIGLYLYGSQGCGKSVAEKTIRNIIDPSVMLSQVLKKDMKELVLELDRHYVNLYDNVSYINQEQSNIFCQAITGSGSEFRKLFTDEDSVIRYFRRIILLNGINMKAVSADLLDRFVTIMLPPIDKKDRMTDKELEDMFLEKRGKILGSIMNILVKAIKKYPELKDKIIKLPRMADATLWCCAIVEAMNYEF